MNEPTMETLARRLDKVERENRRWRRIGVAVLMVVTFALLLGARGQKVAEEVRAKRFVLVDEKGRQRAVLGMGYVDTPTLRFYDEAKTLRTELTQWIFKMSDVGRSVTLNLDSTLPFLELEGRTGTAWLGNFLGHPGLHLSTSAGPQTLLSASDSAAGLEFSAAGSMWTGVRAGIEVAGTGPSFWLRSGSAKSENGIEFRLLDERPTLRFAEKGTVRAALGHMKLEQPDTNVIEQRPASSLVLLNEAGKVIWSAP